MEKIDKIVNEGFSINDHEKEIKSLAFFSLKLALEAYFSTYNAVISNFREVQDNKNYSNLYIESYYKSIIYFQHFFELIIKDILQSEHYLLAVKANRNPIIMHKLLMKEEITPNEEQKLYSIEFREALENLIKLIKSGRMKKERYECLVINKNVLEKLNYLRNRIWHKGTFILNYKSFDELIGRYILPLLKSIINLNDFSSYEHIWKYKKLNCYLDPIDYIIKETQKEEFSFYRIAIHKELGRAAYNNLFLFDKDVNSLSETIKRKVSLLVDDEHEQDFFIDIKDCPVCGLNSLIIYSDLNKDIVESGSYIYRESHKIKCLACDFNLDRELYDKKDKNLPFKDYWLSKIITTSL